MYVDTPGVVLEEIEDSDLQLAILEDSITSSRHRNTSSISIVPKHRQPLLRSR
jgi:hypothetical protein